MPLEVVVFALKIWHYYLSDMRFEFFTNNKSLKYVFNQSDSKLRQRRSMECLKDYDFQLFFHPRKANVMVDALSQKSNARLVQCIACLWAITEEVKAMNPMEQVSSLLTNLVISNDLVEPVKLAQV